MQFQKRVPKEKRLKKQRRLRQRRRILITAGISAALVTVITLAVFITRLDALTIQQIHVTGTETLTEKTLQRTATHVLDGNMALVFPKRSTVLLPKDTLRTTLQRRYPRLQDITVTREETTAITLDVTERSPFGVWCAHGGRYQLHPSTTPPAALEKTRALPKPACYYLDDRGFVYAKAPHFTGDVYFRHYGPLASTTPVQPTTKPYPLAREFLAPDTFNYVHAFIDAVGEKLPIEPTALLKLNRRDLGIALANSGTVRIREDQDLEQAFRNLKTTLNAEAFKTKREHHPLQYIDLRFGEKVFYNFYTQ